MDRNPDERQVADERRSLLGLAAIALIVGAATGCVGAIFRLLLVRADGLREAMIAWAHGHAIWGFLTVVGACAVATLVAAWMVRQFSPHASGSGIPHVEAVLREEIPPAPFALVPVKFFGGILAIGSGLALGREGPTVQMGGAVGAAISSWLKVSSRERLTLISAGAGAGLAAAFNAPLSGLVFVLEEVRRDFQPIVFGAAFIAAAVADIVVRLGSDQFPVFAVPSYPTPPLASLPVFAFLGLVTGVLGVLFNRSLLTVIERYARIPDRFVLPAVAITGGVVGLVGWFTPLAIGSGHSLAETVLKGEFLLSAIPLFFATRLFVTAPSYATGAPGGIFAPLLVLGALIGLAIGQIAHNLSPDIVPIPAVFAVVGMAAYFTAIVRAPLTGIMLIVEMTGNYSQMLPLLVCCFCAYATAEFLKDLPIYEALLERDLMGDGGEIILKEPAIVDFTVQVDAPFDGLEVRSLGLPSGCILVRCSDGKRTWLP